MKTLKLLTVFTFAIFLISFASAVAIYGTLEDQNESTDWRTQEQIISHTITEGESWDFIAEVSQAQSSATVNIKVYDFNEEEIYSFEDNTNVNKGNFFSKQYTVDSNVYQNPGTYDIVISASDDIPSSQNLILYLTVNAIQDTERPVITLLGDNPVTVTQGDSYNDAGATANDNVDGDLTSEIVVDSNVDTNAIGTYTVTYTVEDSSENVGTATRTVNVVAEADTESPVITLIGPDTINLDVGESYTEYGATATDNVDGDITGNIAITNPVNIYAEGTYTVRYNVADSSGNEAGEVTRTVIVGSGSQDTEAPVITLTGSNPQVINLGDSYVELGATANDNVDGDLTSEIVIDSSEVDTGSIGTYTVTYNVMDNAGNSAVEVTRTVSVIDLNDTTAPTITIITPEDNEEYNDEDLTFEVETDEVSEVVFNLNDEGNVTMNFSGSSNGVLTFTYEVLNLEEGNHEVTFYATDSAGNTASETVEFSIDTTTSSKKDDDKDSTNNYINQFRTTSEEQAYLNQFKPKKVIYLDSESSAIQKKGWFERFINWLVNLFE